MAVRFILLAVTIMTLLSSTAHCGEPSAAFSGKYCEGTGDTEYLRLIDESFQFLHPGANVPNVTMIYQPTWDTFNEGANWGAWWIQNSYGFSLCSTPFLQEPWISILLRSWDLHWDNQGDGKRASLWGGSATATWLSHVIGAEGSLGDAAAPGQIAYKQGDGPQEVHDNFYEATAAGLVMTAEILLRHHDVPTINKYMPRMLKACEHIEKVRDPKNNLFLVGPACNLLAPSYGGLKMPDGTFGKAYLAGVSITYAAALDRLVELFKLTGDKKNLALYQHRLNITRDSLKLLLTDKGYFAKSVEPGGTKHGVLGQKQYGYLEGVANADAMCHRIVSDKTAASIYKQIASYPDIRPFDFLLTNAPGLDDTYWSWGNTSGAGFEGFHEFGCWVNGGVWGTVEGRAIMGYYRLNKTDDIRKSATRAMKWAKDFRMDAPFSQRGENTSNPWSDTGSFQNGGVAVMVDNFAIPAATVRGLFEYVYKADRMLLYPHVPKSITEYRQKEPVWFGDKQILISIANGSGKIASVKVNGKAIKPDAADHFSLLYKDLPKVAELRIVMEGAKAGNKPATAVAAAASASKPELPESLAKPYAVLTSMNRLLKAEPGAEYERAFVTEALASIRAWQDRSLLDPGPGYFRPITPERKTSILKFYETAAVGMYNGFAGRMSRYAASADAREKRIAELFAQASR